MKTKPDLNKEIPAALAAWREKEKLRVKELNKKTKEREAKKVTMKINFTYSKPEDNPELFKALFNECERLNNLNADLIRINRNTWVKKTEYPSTETTSSSREQHKGKVADEHALRIVDSGSLTQPRECSKLPLVLPKLKRKENY